MSNLLQWQTSLRAKQAQHSRVLADALSRGHTPSDARKLADEQTGLPSFPAAPPSEPAPTPASKKVETLQRRLAELAERHQLELEDRDVTHQERTKGIRESLDVAQRQAAEDQRRIATLEEDLEAERAAHTSLRESLKPREPEPLVWVEWRSSTHSPASIEDHVYEGRAGERAWMPRGAAEALAWSGMLHILGRASVETSIAATVRGDPVPRTAAELRERAAMYEALANGFEREEAALVEQEQQATAELARRRAEAEIAGARRRAELAQQQAEGQAQPEPV